MWRRPTRSVVTRRSTHQPPIILTLGLTQSFRGIIQRVASEWIARLHGAETEVQASHLAVHDKGYNICVVRDTCTNVHGY